MRPPSAALPGYFPRVDPLPNGNQYGSGFPVNPFATTAPARPVLDFSGGKPGLINRAPGSMPVLQNLKSDIGKQGWQESPGFIIDPTPLTQTQPRTPANVNPVIANNPVASRPINTTGTNLTGANPNVTPTTTQTNTPLSTPAFGPNPAFNSINPDLIPSVRKAVPTDLGYSNFGSVFGVPINSIGSIPTLSDEKTKKDKKPWKSSGNGLLDAGLALGKAIRGGNSDETPDTTTPPASAWTPPNRVEILPGGQRRVIMGTPAEQVAPPPQATFEAGSTNPMMGLGAPAQPTPQPFGQEPAMPQQQVNVPFGSFPSANAGPVTAMSLPLNTDEVTGSDERMKKNVRYVSSPVEAKRDIRPIETAIAPQDYQDQWRGTSMEQSAAPPQQFPQFSMSAQPIVPGRGTTPAVDLRPAQGYSYEYKDPNSPGAKPGRQFGPMAQDLEKTPAGASVVEVDPRTGMKMVDTSRLTMVNTAALSEQQRKIDELMAMLDAANERSTKDTGPRTSRR